MEDNNEFQFSKDYIQEEVEEFCDRINSIK